MKQFVAAAALALCLVDAAQAEPGSMSALAENTAALDRPSATCVILAPSGLQAAAEPLPMLTLSPRMLEIIRIGRDNMGD